jgi:hypothetical protein
MPEHKSRLAEEQERRLLQDILRKYAALALALGLARSRLHDVLMGCDSSPDLIRHTLDLTATDTIARALHLDGSDMSIDWNHYLDGGETARIKGF